jgi:hypothetical protein
MALCGGTETRTFKGFLTFNFKVLQRGNNNLELSTNICFTDTILQVIKVWSN